MKREMLHILTLTSLLSDQSLHAPYHFPPNRRLTPLFLLHSIEIVLHSTLACRLMIGIREASQSYRPKSETFQLSEVPCDGIVVFAHKPPGENARADLEACAGPSKA